MAETRFLKTLRGEIHTDTLIRSVVEVFEEYDRSGKKPGSDRWLHNMRTHRPEMVRDVITRYCQDTGCSPADFPYHSDCIVRVWINWRKLSPAREPEVRRALGFRERQVNP